MSDPRVDYLEKQIENHVMIDRDWKERHVNLHEAERKDRQAFTRNTLIVVTVVILQIGVSVVLHFT